MQAIRTGDYVVWNKPIFKGGSFFRGRSTGKPRLVGHKRLRGIVIRHSYGSTSGQHTFSIVCPSVGKRPVLVKGRNLYPSIIYHVANDESPDRF